MTSRFLVGRSPACGLRLDARHVSGEHATVTWVGGGWEIRDLGSRNGTYLDGVRLEPGLAAPLMPGMRVAFGDPDTVFELLDDGPPAVVAVALKTGAIRVGSEGLLVLPDEANPEVSVYPDASGAWVMEREGELSPVADEDVVSAAGVDYRLHLPGVSEGTPQIQIGMVLETVQLRFGVTRDEERVELTLIHRGMEVPLEPREHGYVLLTLARARREDAELPEADRGWRSRDRLLKMLRMDANALNVAIHRARQQLLAAGVDGAAGIVQVRRGQRRIGTEHFSIVSI